MSDTPAATKELEPRSVSQVLSEVRRLSATHSADCSCLPCRVGSALEETLGWINLAALLSETVVEQEERERALRAALEDALEGMEEMRGYVSDYFREKWGHDAYIERARAALTPPPPTQERTP